MKKQTKVEIIGISISLLIIIISIVSFYYSPTQEVLRYLKGRYGEKFTVLSSSKMDEPFVISGRVFNVKSESRPDFVFHAYKIKAYGDNIAPLPLKRYIEDDYALEFFSTDFSKYCLANGLKCSPIKSSFSFKNSKYYELSGYTVSFDDANKVEVADKLVSFLKDKHTKYPYNKLYSTSKTEFAPHLGVDINFEYNNLESKRVDTSLYLFYGDYIYEKHTNDGWKITRESVIEKMDLAKSTLGF